MKSAYLRDAKGVKVAKNELGVDVCLCSMFQRTSKPAGPLSKDMLSLGGSFFMLKT